MPSADFSPLIPPSLEHGSPKASEEISPGKTHDFHAYTRRIYVPAFRSGLDFELTCTLIQPPRLLCDFCSSGQRFAFDFLQTPPRDDALVFR